MGFADLILRLKALFAHRRAESELDEELKFHLEMEARKRQQSGQPEQAARRAAHVAFGGVERVREACRDVRGLGILENLVRDLQYGFRALAKSPGFTTIAVLSLAIGIGANTWVFSVVDRVLLRTLPVRNPGELVVLGWEGSGKPNLTVAGGNYQERENGAFATNLFSWDAYAEMRARRGVARDIFGYAMFNSVVNVAANGVAEVSGGMLVSGNYFSALGIGTALGRPINADDDSVGGVPSAMIGYRYWQRLFGGSPDVIGTTIYVNRRQHVIVGVARRDFPSLAGALQEEGRAYVILPLRARAYVDKSGVGQHWAAPDRLWVQAMGRVKDSDQSRARAELGAALAARLPDAAGIAPRIVLEPGKFGPSHDARARTLRAPLTIVSVATAVMLLIACANLAGLLLARGAQRRREICLRMSLGASRARVVGQLLCESALVSAAGAALGALLARFGLTLLIPILAAGGRGLPGLDEHLDFRILAFTTAVFALATLLFGLAPALSATRVDLAEGIKEDAGPSRGSGRLRGITPLVALQTAAALLLVTGASLLTRTLVNLRALPLGFKPQNAVIFSVAPGAAGYEEERGLEFYERLTARLQRIPGVTGVTLSRNAPATGWTWSGPFSVSAAGAPRRSYTNFNFVADSYFDVMGIPLLAGRAIDGRDLASSRRVAVVNEAAAKAFGPGSPVGRRFLPPERGPEYEVIGVVRNAVYSRLRDSNPPTIYVPYTQPFGRNWMSIMTFAVRTQASPRGVMPALGAAVREIDPMIPASDMKTLERQLDEHLVQERIMAFLAGLFGSVTLGLACMGVYGMVAFSVAARTREIGIRVALGAGRTRVMRSVMSRLLLASAAGVAIGAPLTYILQQFLRSQLYGVDPGDPVSLVFASMCVAAAAIAAAWLPARRALKIDPMRALRWE